jgi:hypothetical protein
VPRRSQIQAEIKQRKPFRSIGQEAAFSILIGMLDRARVGQG